MSLFCLDQLNCDALLRDRTLFLRSQRPDDGEFLRDVFREIRRPEFAVLGWPEPMLNSFLDSQFQAQSRHYSQVYPDAAFAVIAQGGQPVGRLYLQATPTALHIVDISVAAAWRNGGIGATLLSALGKAAAARQAVTLNVERTNPARRLYSRLGFLPSGEHGPYQTMAWHPGDGA